MAIYHILPNKDIKKHSEYTAIPCECNPKIKTTETGDMLVIHNSYDGREIIEEINEILKQIEN